MLRKLAIRLIWWLLFVLSYFIVSSLIGVYFESKAPLARRQPVAGQVPKDFPIVVVSQNGSSAKVIDYSELAAYLKTTPDCSFFIPQNAQARLADQLRQTSYDSFVLQSQSAGKQYLEVQRSSKTECKNIGWYVVDSHGFKPLYYANYSVEGYYRVASLIGIFVNAGLWIVAHIIVYLARYLKKRNKT